MYIYTLNSCHNKIDRIANIFLYMRTEYLYFADNEIGENNYVLNINIEVVSSINQDSLSYINI